MRFRDIEPTRFLLNDVQDFRFRSWLWLNGYVLTTRVSRRLDSVFNDDYEIELSIGRRLVS